MASEKKKYGLIIPSKKKTGTGKIAKPSVFGDSSSDEEVRYMYTIIAVDRTHTCSMYSSTGLW